MELTLQSTFESARRAGRDVARRDESAVNRLLMALADRTEASIDSILAANVLDLERMDKENPKYDRLKLTRERLRDIASDMRSVASLPSPLGRVLSSVTRPNGMRIDKVTVPFGVIGIIYEARPNVTFDVFSLCVKAGSACLLKGGTDADHTNRAVVGMIKSELECQGWDTDSVTLLPASHEATAEMLRASQWVDVIIPRGSKGLIDYVRENSLVPVIETGAGVCHTYLHSSGDAVKARDIVFNAKTRRPSVCNTLDTLVVDSSRLSDLPQVCAPLAGKNVVIYADGPSYTALSGRYPLLEHATDADFGREWLDYKMSIRTVEDMDEALDVIERYGSRHSECIVAEDKEAVEVFLREVDAACVYANVSTAFTDGGQFGFGAEIGISTQKLHARGPMALPEITTYKYLIYGDGQVR
ncbi:MAG: glutamate-5-semialdehyde dehydrogenase [Pseudoflavonifractor sp.]|nr:glutamate-5-semialdehyde dehydrogenase [Pseudoflavonifractor sp.]